MPRYLWCRPSGWVFQVSVPKASRHLGVSPFRIGLGRLTAIEARWRARILAGWAAVAMEREVSREEVSRGLIALARELANVRREAFGAGIRMLNAQTVWSEEAANGETADPDIVRHFQKAEAKHRERRDALRRMQVRLDLIGSEIKRDGEDWAIERATYERTLDRLSTMRGQSQPDIPHLSIIAEEIIGAKEQAIGGRSGYPARLRRAVRSFILIVGDKTVDQYMPLDLQRYVSIIGALPSTWTSDKRLRNLTPIEAIERAKTIKGLKPISKTTVAEYLAEFRSVWMVVRATYPDHARALGHEDVRLTLPRSAARPVEREGLPIKAINTWLANAARERRPDDKYLPLLGALTGARLGELVGLQVEDLHRFEDHWTLSLVEDVEDEDGETHERQVKTEQSRRVIALPDAIADTGFIQWAGGLRIGPLWPQLLRSVRPHATASKRMMRVMKQLGIHGPGQTFHSLRHGYKDYLRVMKVDKRTINQQVGHAHDSVGEGYGAKTLRPDEIRLIATLALPDGLDLKPYSEVGAAPILRRTGRPRKDATRAG
ncbi:phage integrase family protein [Azorhizobium sp. AG788]|uniref:tyrosine-type recombinase/integrase n=1 Tax=Azorhizobium sp. AG788 TaxID=2183897 RepID=UPI001061C8BA|nr:tyrosine-type recombinase/integrase [Azorhizobium sp. AG788]TDT96710.1 phage integrase family protein [Azorhizobium sp. AG788]